MPTIDTRGVAAALALVTAAACSSARPATTPAPAGAPAAASPSASAPAAAAHDMAGMDHSAGATSAASTGAAAGGHAGHDMGIAITIPPGANYVKADVEFMQGMIAHHAQAIYMSRLAAGRQASPRLIKFATKIDQSQESEIRLMQEWLVANKQVAPDTSSWRGMMMAGMLTTAQLDSLEKARGVAFDEHYLRYMIQHHQGALKMVTDLYATPRAAQDVDVSVFANDVETTQTAEIAAMYQMLSTLRTSSTTARP